MSDSSVTASTLTSFTPAETHKVKALTRILSRMRVFFVSLAVENPFMWSRLRGKNPRSDLAGPYHILGAPNREVGGGKVVMASASELKAFTPYLLSLTVQDERGSAISNAEVDWWQADTSGDYYFDTYNLRGKFKTDAHGRAEILSVSPGEYGPPGHIRAGHFHAIITPPGRKYQSLTTQMYVCPANDPAALHTDILNSYRSPRTQNVLQSWSIPRENGTFLNLPVLSETDTDTLSKLDSWSSGLAAADTNLKIVAGAQTVIQLSDRSRMF